MSNRFRKGLYVVGIVVLLAIAALGVLSTPWFRHVLERRIIAGLEDLTGGRVEIGELRFRPAAFQIVFHNLVIHGSEPTGEAPLFSARTVVVGLSPSFLLRRQLRLRNLDWDQASLHVRTSPDGSTNIPGPAGHLEAVQAVNELIDLSIGRVTLAHSSFYWNDQRMPLDFDARELAILLRLSHGHRYVGSIASTGTILRAFRWSPAPITLTGRFEFSRTDLAMTSLAWQGRGMSGRGSFTLRNFSAPEAYFSYQAVADLPVLAKTVGGVQVQNGDVRLEGQGIFRHGGLSAHGRAVAQQVALRGPSFNPGRLDVSADYAVEPDRIELANLSLAAFGGTARGSGEILLRASPPRFRFHTQLHDLDLAAFLQSSSAPLLVTYLRPRSRIDGTAETEWTGRLENFTSRLELLFRAPDEPSAGSLPMSGKARATFSLAGGPTVRIAQAEFHAPRSSLTAQGVLAASASPASPASKLDFRWQSSNFEEWRPLVEFLSGDRRPVPLVFESPATVIGNVSGSISEPEMNGRLELGAFDFHGWRWDRLMARVIARPNFAAISSGSLEHESSALNLEASASLTNWRLTPDSTVRVAVRAEQTPLEGLCAALGVRFPISGRASGQLDLLGSASKLAGTGTLRIDSGALADEPFDSFFTHIRVANSVWNLEGIQLAKGHGRATGQLSYEPSRQSLAGELHGGGFSLTEFRRWTPSAHPAGPAGRLEGRVGFDLRGEGTPESLQFHSAWNIQEITVAGNVLGDLRAQIDGQGERLRVDAAGSGPSGTLSLSGECRVGETWPLELEGQYAAFRLDPWIRLLLNGKFSATVKAGGSFKLSGPLQDVARLELQSQAQTLEVSFPSLIWKNAQPVEVRYASGTLIADEFRMRGPSTDLEIAGSLRFARPRTLALSAQGKADATLLSLIDPSLQASGRSEARLRITGDPGHPVLNGTLDVQDVSLSYGDLPFRLSSLEGTIQLEGERAIMRSLRGVSGGGTVNLGGFITLAETPRFQLQADLDQVRLRYPPNFTSVLNGALRLSGTSERGQLQGELVLRQMFTNENTNWLAQMLEAGGRLAEQTLGVPSPLAAKIRLDVRVNSVPPVRLETRDMRLVADVDLRLQGTLANPVQVGTIHFLDGEAVFRGNRYRLVRGDLSLTNPFRTQTVLDLEAQTRVQRYELTLDVSGPFDRLKFAYRSDPPLPTADILSLLALGYSRQQEEMAMGGGHPLPTVGASALLSEALSSQVTGRIQRLFGVSRIKIDPNVGTPGYSSGARVTVEQQVTRDLMLTYVTNTAASQYRVIQFELAVSDNVSVVGLRDQNGIFGLEVKFRQRFK